MRFRKNTDTAITLSLIAVGSLITVGISSSWAAKNSGLAVLSSPKSTFKRSYKTFAPYELGFALPTKAKPNHAYRSESFYGVILKKAPNGAEPECDNGEFSSKWERERQRIQKLFTNKKVFADHQCPDMGAVSYIIEGVPNTRPLIGIYGGKTPKEAAAVKAKIVKSYPKASIHRITVSFEVIAQ